MVTLAIIETLAGVGMNILRFTNGDKKGKKKSWKERLIDFLQGSNNTAGYPYANPMNSPPQSWFQENPGIWADPMYGSRRYQITNTPQIWAERNVDNMNYGMNQYQGVYGGYNGMNTQYGGFNRLPDPCDVRNIEYYLGSNNRGYDRATGTYDLGYKVTEENRKYGLYHPGRTIFDKNNYNPYTSSCSSNPWNNVRYNNNMSNPWMDVFNNRRSNPWNNVRYNNNTSNPWNTTSNRFNSVMSNPWINNTNPWMEVYGQPVQQYPQQTYQQVAYPYGEDAYQPQQYVQTQPVQQPMNMMQNTILFPQQPVQPVQQYPQNNYYNYNYGSGYDNNWADAYTSSNNGCGIAYPYSDGYQNNNRDLWHDDSYGMTQQQMYQQQMYQQQMYQQPMMAPQMPQMQPQPQMVQPQQNKTFYYDPNNVNIDPVKAAELRAVADALRCRMGLNRQAPQPQMYQQAPVQQPMNRQPRPGDIGYKPESWEEIENSLKNGYFKNHTLNPFDDPANCAALNGNFNQGRVESNPFANAWSVDCSLNPELSNVEPPVQPKPVQQQAPMNMRYQTPDNELSREELEQMIVRKPRPAVSPIGDHDISIMDVLAQVPPTPGTSYDPHAITSRATDEEAALFRQRRAELERTGKLNSMDELFPDAAPSNELTSEQEYPQPTDVVPMFYGPDGQPLM